MKCDELKVETVVPQGSAITLQMYGKAEVDAAIAELKAKLDKAIAEQKDKLQNVSSLLKETREWLVESQKLHKRCADNAVKVIRHNKYKRCLAMAELCEAENYTACWYHENSERCEWTEKWHKRWLELAENFKEAK